MADTTTTLKDAAYVLIGLGVIGVQRAQVRRQELTKRLEQQRQQLEARLEPLVGGIEDRLPAPAAKLVAQAREVIGNIAA